MVTSNTGSKLTGVSRRHFIHNYTCECGMEFGQKRIAKKHKKLTGHRITQSDSRGYPVVI